MRILIIRWLLFFALVASSLSSYITLVALGGIGKVRTPNAGKTLGRAIPVDEKNPDESTEDVDGSMLVVFDEQSAEQSLLHE